MVEVDHQLDVLANRVAHHSDWRRCRRRDAPARDAASNLETSLVFKTLQVVRFFDRKRNVLVYVAYSDRFIEGSPKNSISSVPIMGWPVP